MCGSLDFPYCLLIFGLLKRKSNKIMREEIENPIKIHLLETCNKILDIKVSHVECLIRITNYLIKILVLSDVVKKSFPQNP